jgi:hypothetical protein
MLFIERDKDGGISAIYRDKQKPEQESASLFDNDILTFLQSSGDIETLTQLLTLSDTSIVRVLEDLIDLLIEKKVILFTELPPEAQEKIQGRKRLRAEMGSGNLMVDDIL